MIRNCCVGSVASLVSLVLGVKNLVRPRLGERGSVYIVSRIYLLCCNYCNIPILHNNVMVTVSDFIFLDVRQRLLQVVLFK